MTLPIHRLYREALKANANYNRLLEDAENLAAHLRAVREYVELAYDASVASNNALLHALKAHLPRAEDANE